MSNHIHLEVSLPASPERYYEFLINGAKFGDVTGQPGKGGGSEGAYSSVITSKPAIRDRLKTGHTGSDRDKFI